MSYKGAENTNYPNNKEITMTKIHNKKIIQIIKDLPSQAAYIILLNITKFQYNKVIINTLYE